MKVGAATKKITIHKGDAVMDGMTGPVGAVAGTGMASADPVAEETRWRVGAKPFDAALNALADGLAQLARCAAAHRLGALTPAKPLRTLLPAAVPSTRMAATHVAERRHPTRANLLALGPQESSFSIPRDQALKEFKRSISVIGCWGDS